MTKPRIQWISPDDPPESFPSVQSALSVPNGLLAAGGDLAPERLVYAYRHAIFPWFDSGQPILWWSPDPRCVLVPGAFHIARRFRRSLRGSQFRVSCNQSFANVINACAEQRVSAAGTWITADMIEAYITLHRLGWAHSVEIWHEHTLVGGIYGLAIGKVFFGESMFSRASDASKVALLALCRHLADHDFAVIDCQMPSPHLLSLGAELMPRDEFTALLRSACVPATHFRKWPEVEFSAEVLSAA
ncbi:MAG TPA: leucyl/phenylalanyl-tRNA--protein transferase [Woeseiaceae bacterium]